MSGIFISYRRIDSTGFAGRLFDHLSRHFGHDKVFMDIEGGIERGADFPTVIQQTLQSADAMIVVIGRQWLTCVDTEGKPRLSRADDWVRAEVASALKRNILVLPVLVDGATMPAAEQLPQDIQPLAKKQAGEITGSRWDYDVAQLITILDRTVAKRRPRSLNQPLTILGALAIAIVVALGIKFYNARESETAAPVAEPPPKKTTAQDLRGFWRDDDGKLYKIVPRDGGDFDMGRIEPPETDPVYRVVHVKNRSIEIAIGTLPSGTQQAVANLELSADGNIMAGLLKSTQIEDLPQNWVLRRTAGEPVTTTPPRPTSK